MIIYDYLFLSLRRKAPKKMQLIEFANSLDPDEVAPNEPPHKNLHCLPFSI